MTPAAAGPRFLFVHHARHTNNAISQHFQAYFFTGRWVRPTSSQEELPLARTQTFVYGPNLTLLLTGQEVALFQYVHLLQASAAFFNAACLM